MWIQQYLRGNKRGLIWAGVLLFGLVIAAVWFTRDTRLEGATIKKLNDAQTI